MNTNKRTSGLFDRLSEQDERLARAEQFNLDIVLQLYQLREQRGLTQSQLAESTGTRQQAISRMESPGYDRHTLSKLRQLAESLGAFVDVTIVPEEKLDEYLEWRYQPVLMEAAPGREATAPLLHRQMQHSAP